MRALTVEPGVPNSIELADVPPPPAGDGDVLVRALALGICGTDREIIAGDYGAPPPGARRLILGHESLGRVEEAPQGSGFARGDLVVGIVRRPDPVPCAACAIGEWDMCRNGLYTERGIKERNGYGAEQFRIEPRLCRQARSRARPARRAARAGERGRQGLGPGRAHRQAQRDPGSRASRSSPAPGRSACWRRCSARSAALNCTFSTATRDGPKPDLARALGATYHSGDLGKLAPDVVIECTGAGAVVLDAMRRTAPQGIVCLAGVSSGGHKLKFDVGDLNRDMVLENDVVFGSVNANRRHYAAAAEALAKADKDWLARLITRTRAAVALARGVRARATTTSKSSLDFTA